MAIQFYNTYSRELDAFTPLDPTGKKVKVYTCGPTVYSFAHIGNLRSFLFEDLLQRHLEARGHQIQRVMNLTDVDDKTIRDSRAANLPLHEFTKQFVRAFFSDCETLRIKPADAYPAATEPENIQRMIEMVDLLMRKDIAYQADDRSIYFRINRFPDYGKLAHLNLEELRPSGRVRADDYEKESVGDFALWKAWDEEDGHVGWDSPWGRGRPGWHIECSAMAMRLLGEEIDIHCGGVDNIFPHHEAEIAQSESCTGHKFVRYWLHCAHLLVDGQKMSKSLGNFYTLRDLLNQGYSGRQVRYALLRVNYRLPLNFTQDNLIEARQSLLRIDEWLQRLRDLAGSAAPDPDYARDFTERFLQALDDDLNISAALAELFEEIRTTNRALDSGEVTPAQAAALWREWDRINQVLQVQDDEVQVPAEIQGLLEVRARARHEKNWRESDALRDRIGSLGWMVKDTKEGQKVARQG
jgi:cysteinyl-tRNA synthetase